MGSIPAHAGEPLRDIDPTVLIGVYPRARGGTVARLRMPRPIQGLSPRTRGNHIFVDEFQIIFGSIPAHAGEPRHVSAPLRFQWVYPRARGGTTPPVPISSCPPGLSPRTRGNQKGRRLDRGGIGSIPAHAGEPRIVPSVCTVIRVYPRARGGTLFFGDCNSRVLGLSPRTRGNRR